MDNSFRESRKALEQAREALRRGDRSSALKWGQEAARLAPQSEDPWLILAAVASPQASIEHIKKALEANPESPRAHKAMLWAMQRLQSVQAAPTAVVPATPSALASPAGSVFSQKAQPAADQPRKVPKLLFPALLLGLGCLVLIVAAWSAVRNPALAAIWSSSAQSQPTATAQVQHWAQAELPKPTSTVTLTPEATPIEMAQSFPTVTASPEVIASPTDTAVPEADLGTSSEASPTLEFLPTAENAAAPEASPTPAAGMEAVIVPDTPTSEYIQPPPAPELANEAPPPIPAAARGERWIDVDLSRQMVSAYEGDALMNSFIVSTGTWQTPTVTGTYKIWIKLRSTTMTGPGYYLPNVPYTMYFYKGYGLHGTYWHNNFGTPMSHGCVNLRTGDAEWLFNFASVGTTVNVHY